MSQPTRADSPTKICTEPDCDRPLRARGFCSSHYNRNIVGEERRHPSHTVPCIICGTNVNRRVHSRYATTCSVRCRSIVQWGKRLAQPSAYQWRHDAEKRARDAGARIIESFDRDEIFDRDSWLCQVCGIKCAEPDPYDRASATVDHTIALSQGGDHTRANAQTCCLSCNSAKGDRGVTTRAA